MADQQFKDEILIATNRKAHYNYFLSEFTECGIELKGSEIKALRAGHCTLDDAYVIITGGECFVLNMKIPVPQNNKVFIHEETRTRKLLLHKDQIRFFENQVNREGFTLIPIRVYIRNQFCKVQIALGKGKKNYDKRETIKKREDERYTAQMQKGKWNY